MSNTMPHTTERRREITLNGRPVSTDAATVGELVVSEGFGTLKVATAVNGAFVPVRARAVTPIKSGDSVEILSARQGG